MRRETWDTYEDVLEQGDIPLFGLKFVVAINADGQRCYEMRTIGDARSCALEAIGAIEVVKQKLAYEAAAQLGSP